MRHHYAVQAAAVAVLALSLCVAVSSSSSSSSSVWPHVAGSVSNTGQVGRSVSQSPHEQWTFNTNNVIVAGTVVSKDMLFVGTQQGIMYGMKLPTQSGAGHSIEAAFGAGNPKVVWKVQAGGSIDTAGTLSPDGSVLYFGAGSSKFYAVNTATGALVFPTIPTFSGVSSPITLGAGGDLAFFGTASDIFFAVNTTTGSLRWRCAARSTISGAPTVSSDGKTVYMASDDNFIYAFKALDVKCLPGTHNGLGSVCQTITGKETQIGCDTWSLSPTGASITTSPVLDEPNHRLLVTTSDADGSSTISSINLDMTYEGVNTVALCQCVHNVVQGVGKTFNTAPVLVDNTTMVVGCNDGSLYAMNSWTGEHLWTYSTQGAITSAPIVTSDKQIVFGSMDKTLYCVSSSGSLVWKFATKDSLEAPVALAPNGMVIVGGTNGILYAVGGPNPLIGMIVVYVVLALLVIVCCGLLCRRLRRRDQPVLVGFDTPNDQTYVKLSHGGKEAAL